MSMQTIDYLNLIKNKLNIISDKKSLHLNVKPATPSELLDYLLVLVDLKNIFTKNYFKKPVTVISEKL